LRADGVVLLALAVFAAGCAGAGSGTEAGGDAGPLAEPAVDETFGAVAGFVLDDEDGPLAKAEVGLKLPADLRRMNTTTAGEFAFEQVPPGRHQLLAQRIGFESYAGTIDVAAGAIARVTIRLAPTVIGPDFPREAAMAGLSTHGGWFQIPYAEAAAALPEGFEPKPHVLLEPNGASAEYSVYTSAYEDVVVAGQSLGPGAWTFEVLSVVPPEEHGGVSHTVEYFVFGSYASHARLAELLTSWGVPTVAADVSFEAGALGADTYRTESTVETAAAALTLTTIASQEQGSALTGGALDVRVFAVADGGVTNYVIINLVGLAYSLTTAASIDGEGLAFSPSVPDGPGYAQWGAEATQALRYEPL
jgi:hypothetical protein